MHSSAASIDTGARVQHPEQHSAQHSEQQTLKTRSYTASDFTIECDDAVHPDLDVGRALQRLKDIEDGKAETNPLRAAVDALGGDGG